MVTEAVVKSTTGPIRVVAVSGLPDVRKILAADPGLTFVQSSGDAEEALAVAQGLAPCVLILNGDALAALKPGRVATLLERDVRTIVLLPNPDDRTTIELVRTGYAGVLGVLNKKRLLKKAIRAVASGEIWASRRLLSELVRDRTLSSTRVTSARAPHKMTPREAEILELITQGCTNREIAESLFVTRETVRWHERRLYSKLGIRDRGILFEKHNKRLPSRQPSPVQRTLLKSTS